MSPAKHLKRLLDFNNVFKTFCWIKINSMPVRYETIKNIDYAVAGGLVLVFGLPLTLLIPGFSVWDIIPKLRVTRFHIIVQVLTWPQINSAIAVLLSFFFCLYLEIRKRKLDDMVEKVLTVKQAADNTLEVEQERQRSSMKACVTLLDSSTEHYEHLMLLSDELRKIDKMNQQHPPMIELSTSCI